VTRHLADVVTLSIRPELAGTTRLELANQLIENQSAFHFAFIPVIVVRVERFELITKLVLSQPPLPIGLHAQEKFEFRNSNFEICFGPGGGIRTHTV
jgi:hypothetical protein